MMGWGATNPPGGPITMPFGRVEAPDRTVCQYTGRVMSPRDAAVCDEADSSEDR